MKSNFPNASDIQRYIIAKIREIFEAEYWSLPSFSLNCSLTAVRVFSKVNTVEINYDQESSLYSVTYQAIIDKRKGLTKEQTDTQVPEQNLKTYFL
jgi:hypothetical protein